MSLEITALHAQVRVTGTIWDEGSRTPVGSVNVMLQNPERRVMYGYAITKEDGVYSLTYDGKADSLLLVVTGFNIKEQTRAIPARDGRVDFYVETGDLEIREVTVKAPPVTRLSDRTYTSCPI